MATTGRNNDNWLSQHSLETWHGVTIDSNGYVTFLVMPYNNLSGSIPAMLGALDELISLRLGHTGLSGPIPATLGALDKLISLSLNNNDLSGSIPTELGNLENLQQLWLSNNELSGSIPSELGNLDSLRRLNLHNNNLSGSIPAELGDMGRLMALLLSGNGFSGCVPDALRNVSSNDLSDLSLPFCTEGSATPTPTATATPDPDATATPTPTATNTPDPNATATPTPTATATPDPQIATTERAALVAFYNATGGDNWTNNSNWLSAEPLGTWHGVRTDSNGNVTSLRLSDNNLSGSIPAALGNMDSVTLLYLHDNNLSGTIPGELGNLSTLESLWLRDNELSGSIPAGLGNLSNLTSLYLSSNGLSGSIPSELGNLVNVTRLELGYNELSGSIPAELGNLDKLETLGLASNELSGSIPAELGNLDSVTRLYLHDNKLSGSIPAELGNLSTLESLWLRDNELSGSIPAELGNLDKLETLTLNGNSLSGCVPDALSDTVVDSDIYVAGLQFCSDTPPPAPDPVVDSADRDALVSLYNSTDGANWTNKTNWLSGEPIGSWHGVTTDEDGRVQELSLRRNGLNGTIPDLSGLTQLSRLYLDDNQLTGSLAGLSGLSQLATIYLQRNQLSGSFPDLSTLTQLRIVYLYDNQFSGPVLNLNTLVSLRFLEIQNNSLSGPIEGLQDLYGLEGLELAGNQLCLPSDFERSAVTNAYLLTALDSLGLTTCTADESSSVPGTPQSLTTTTGEGQVILAWEAVTNAASYDLHAWDTVGRQWGSIGGVITSTSYTHTVETDGRSYYYKVRARDTNSHHGAWSEEVYANFSGSQFPPPPPSMGLGSDYYKYADASGVSVVASWYVPDSFLIRAQGIITGMFSSRSDLLADLADQHTKVWIKPATRGFAIRKANGWWAYVPQHDTYCHTSVHEVAHLVHYLFEGQDLDSRIQTMYQDAMDAGLWTDAYASTNDKEYWAEGVNFQLTKDYESRYSSTLAEYDSDLAALVDEVFGTTTLPASCDE